MDYKEVFQNLKENEESITYIANYKGNLKNSSNLLEKVRPEILNLKTKGEVCIYVYENIYQTDNPLKLSKAELSYLFKILFEISPFSSLKKDDLERKLGDYVHDTFRVADLAKNSCYW